jgi:hypothetical protein
LASCHSEAFGRIFCNVGVPHVICIDEKTQMMDEAAIEFAKFFYTFVFQGKSICDAYKMTKNQLTINPNKSEEFIKNV